MLSHNFKLDPNGPSLGLSNEILGGSQLMPGLLWKGGWTYNAHGF